MASSFSPDSISANSSVTTSASITSKLIPRGPVRKKEGETGQSGLGEVPDGGDEDSIFGRKRVVQESLGDILKSEPPVQWSMQQASVYRTNCCCETVESSASCPTCGRRGSTETFDFRTTTSVRRGSQASFKRLTKALHLKIGASKASATTTSGQEHRPRVQQSIGKKEDSKSHLMSTNYSSISHDNLLLNKTESRLRSPEGGSQISTTVSSFKQEDEFDATLSTSPFSDLVKGTSLLTLESSPDTECSSLNLDKDAGRICSFSHAVALESGSLGRVNLKLVPKEAAPRDGDNLRELAMFFKSSGPEQNASLSSKSMHSSTKSTRRDNDASSRGMHGLLSSSVVVYDKKRLASTPSGLRSTETSAVETDKPTRSSRAEGKQLSMAFKDSRSPSLSMLKIPASSRRQICTPSMEGRLMVASQKQASLATFPDLIDIPEGTKRISLRTAEVWQSELSDPTLLGDIQDSINDEEDLENFHDVEDGEVEIDEVDGDYQSMVSHIGHASRKVSQVSESEDTDDDDFVEADARTLSQQRVNEVIPAVDLSSKEAQSNPIDSSSSNTDTDLNLTLHNSQVSVASTNALRKSLVDLSILLQKILTTGPASQDSDSTLLSTLGGGLVEVDSLAPTLRVLAVQLSSTLTCIVNALS